MSQPEKNTPELAQASENKLLSDSYNDVKDALELLYIHHNQSGRLKFLQEWPILARYVLGDDLIRYDSEGTDDLDDRAQKEVEAEARRLELCGVVEHLEARSVEKSVLQLEYVQGLIDALGRDFALLLYAERLVDRFAPVPAPVPAPVSETAVSAVSAPEVVSVSVVEAVQTSESIDVSAQDVPVQDVVVEAAAEIAPEVAAEIAPEVAAEPQPVPVKPEVSGPQHMISALVSAPKFVPVERGDEAQVDAQPPVVNPPVVEPPVSHSQDAPVVVPEAAPVAAPEDDFVSRFALDDEILPLDVAKPDVPPPVAVPEKPPESED